VPGQDFLPVLATPAAAHYREPIRSGIVEASVRCPVQWLPVAAMVVAVGCLFETTPPKRTIRPGEEPVDPSTVVVTGLVQLLDRIDRDVSAAPGWFVSVVWYRADVTGDGQPEEVSRSVVQAGIDGVYRATYASNQVVRASFSARVCVLDPDVLQGCCLDSPPCNGCQVWLPPRTIDVAPGARLQQNLTVPCDFVP